MAKGGLTQKMASSAVWSYAAQFGGRGIVFAGLAVMARLLTPTEFGVFGMAMVAVSFLDVGSNLGLMPALIYLTHADEAEAELARDTGFVISVGGGLLLGGIMLALAPVASVFFGTPEVVPLMQVLAVYFVIETLGVVPDAMLNGDLAFGKRFWSQTAQPFGRYLLAIALALGGLGVWSLVGGQIVGVLAGVVGVFVLTGWRPRFRFSLQLARRLLKYSSQVSVVNVLSGLALNLDYLLVGRFLGTTALGLYTMAFKLPDTTIVAMSYVLGNLLLPLYVQLQKEGGELREGFVTAFRYLVMALAPCAAGMYVLAPVIVPVLLGPQWDAAVPVVQVLAIASFFNGMLFAVGPVFLAAGRPRLLMAAEAVWAFSLVPLLYLGAQRSIVAVGVAHIVGVVTYSGFKLFLVCRLLDLRWQRLVQAVTSSLVATAAMVVVLEILLMLLQGEPDTLVLAATVVAGVAVYGVVIFLLDAQAIAHARAVAAPVLGRS